MRKHPILSGLAILTGAGIALFFVFYAISSFFGEGTSLMEKEKVGVVVVEGVLHSSQKIVEQLDEFDEDDAVRAVVLRINSPGGGIVPAQEIYDKVIRLRKHKKVVASMGSVAASGGYYIACAADRIVANPGSITGSIGVIIYFSQFDELLKKIGLKATVIKSGRYKDTGSPFRTMTPEEERLMQGVIDDIYDQFIEMVASRRKIPKEKLAAVADAQIVTGRQALALGLVDELGTLDDAIDVAAKLAGVEEEPEVVYPKKEKPDILKYFMEGLTSAMTKAIEEKVSGAQYLYLDENAAGFCR
ncbi:MAG: signal peptide peptidase SppA [Deltaproteobacteria bacterium]|nr:signal peptide peptidase SppA [Deltaproteobacteria bacterium]